MSPEWTWGRALAAGLLPTIGHIYHFVLAVNVTSALGLRETTLARLRLFLLGGLLSTSALFLWKQVASPWWTWEWPLRGYAWICLVSGGIIMPIASLVLALRRRPTGITGHAEMLDLAARDGPQALIGQGRGSWQLWIPGNESFHLRRREWRIDVPELPPGLEGLTIAQLTDLHFSPCFDRCFFERVVEACGVWDADLVVVTGDLVDDDSVHDWLEPVLGPLSARLGKYAILGNHDSEHHPERILAAIEHAGFMSVEGRWITIERNGVRIALGGTSAPWGPRLCPVSIPEAEYRLLLSHSPDRFYQARDWGIDLVLSGHNHGGQVRLPAVGPIFMPSLYSRRFDRGFFRAGKTLMYVAEGIGAEHPIRFGCPPEITRFELTRGPVSAPSLTVFARGPSAKHLRLLGDIAGVPVEVGMENRRPRLAGYRIWAVPRSTAGRFKTRTG